MTFTRAVLCVHLIICLVSEMFSALRSSSSLYHSFFLIRITHFKFFTTFLPFSLLASLLLLNSSPRPHPAHQESEMEGRIRTTKNEEVHGFSRTGWKTKSKKNQKLKRDKERLRNRTEFLSVPERNECLLIRWIQDISEVFEWMCLKQANKVNF